MTPTQKMRLSWMAVFVAVIGLAASGFRLFRRGGALPRDMRNGGVELVYDLDVRRALDERFSSSLDQVVDALRAKGVTVTRVQPAPRSATIVAPGLDEARLKAALGDTGLAAGPVAPTGAVTVSLPPDMARRLEDAALQQAARVLHDRAEKLGWCVPTVRQAAGRLLVGLPGLAPEQAARAKAVLGRRGRLELREVDDGAALAAALPDDARALLVEDAWNDPRTGQRVIARTLQAADAAQIEAVRARLALPGGLEPLIEASRDPEGRAQARLYLVRRAAVVTGDNVKEADGQRDPTGGWEVNLVLDEAGGQKFTAATTRLVGRKLAIVLDGAIQSTPVVMSPITGGRVRITLGGEPDQKRAAENLALVLRVGPLPAPVTLASERIVGPAK